MKTTLSFISMLLIAGALAGIAYIGFLGVQTYQKATRNEAVANCLQTSSISWTSQETTAQPANTVSEPNRYWVQVCMQEMGYELQTELR